MDTNNESYPQMAQIFSDKFLENKSAFIGEICGEKICVHLWLRSNLILAF
jgi:hypothetical protein